MYKLSLTFIFFILCLQGCAWLGVGYGGFEKVTSVVKNPNLTSFSLENCHSVWPDTYGAFQSKEKIIENWGKPDDIYTDGDVQHLIYEQDLIWSGISLGLIMLPIPLKIPTDREYCEVILTKGKATKLVHHRSGKDRFLGCWLYPVFHTGDWIYGCGKKEL